MQCAFGVSGDLRLMGDHDDGHALLIELLEDLHNLLAGFGVQCAGGFVRQQHLGVVHNRSGNGHTLALTAGKLGGLKVDPVAQAHSLQSFSGDFLALFAAHTCIEQGQCHIVQGGLPGQQVKALKHKANAVQPHIGKFGIAALGNVLSLQKILSGGGTVQTADNIHQCGFAGTRWSHDGHIFPLVHGKGDVFEHRHIQFPLIVGFVDVL